VIGGVTSLILKKHATESFSALRRRKMSDEEMVIIDARNLPVFMLDRSIVEDPKLSWAAKGVYAFIRSRSPGQDVGIADVLAAGNDPGLDVWDTLEELRRAGLISREDDDDYPAK